MTTPFTHIARWYDLLYRSRDTEREVDFVDTLIRRHHPSARTLLDLGCGTGRYLQHLCGRGYAITGVDRSAEMLDEARLKLSRSGGSDVVVLEEQDIRSLRLESKFDVVVALFHVFSYLAEPGDLESTIASISSRTNSGALLLFDAWYGPGVVVSPPESRTVKCETTHATLVRTAHPEHDPQNHRIRVRYDLTVTERMSGETQEFTETHEMRYLFPQDIEPLLASHGFKLLICAGWMTDTAPSVGEWNTYWLAQRL